MATRSNRFFSGLITGYGSIVANMVFTMVSIPLALHYLSKEEFGLWALALQVSGYLSLLELGMSGAMSRFVADHKDDVDGGEYGSLLFTGTLVFVIQGIVIALVGVGLAWLAPSLFAIPAHLAGQFSRILALLAVITGISVVLRTVGAPLWAFQRMDVINGCMSGGLMLRLGLMWLGFHLGWGIYSLAVPIIPPTILTLWVHGWICLRNHYYPSRGHWGRPRWDIFKEVFAYARDGLLLNLGGQLVNATQITIVSRVLGLDAAATFSIATKIFAMAQQVFHKVIESAAPGLTEMYIRGEISLFIRRYWDIIAVTLAASTIGAVALAAGNSAFIALWTGGSITWCLTGDLLLGLLLVLTSLSRCFVSVFGMTKELRSVRILYFVEGLVFVPCAIVAARWFGLDGVLGASLVAHLAVTLFFSARAASKVLGSCKPLLPDLLVALVLIAVAYTVACIGQAFRLTPAVWLAVACLPILAGIMLVWLMTVPVSIRLQIGSAMAALTRRLRSSPGKV